MFFGQGSGLVSLMYRNSLTFLNFACIQDEFSERSGFNIPIVTLGFLASLSTPGSGLVKAVYGEDSKWAWFAVIKVVRLDMCPGLVK